MSKREPGFRVGRKAGRYAGDGWSKRTKMGRWKQEKSVNRNWHKVEKSDKTGCFTVIVSFVILVSVMALLLSKIHAVI